MTLHDETLDEEFKIVIRFCEPSEMRYDTTDDYQWIDGHLAVTIVKGTSRLDRMAILIHALAEWAVAREQGVTIKQIDEWDFAHPESEQPGEEPGCPYMLAHFIATEVENLFRDATQELPNGAE